MDGALEGYVYRQYGGKNKSWQKLWMKWDHSKRMLIIMKGPESEHLEYISISEWIGAAVDMSIKSKYYNFNIYTINCVYKLATEKVEERNDWLEYLIQLMEKRDYGDLSVELSIPRRNKDETVDSNVAKVKKKFEDKKALSSSLPDVSIDKNIQLSTRKGKEDSKPKSVRRIYNHVKDEGHRNTFHGEEYSMEKGRHMVTGLNNEDIYNLHNAIENTTDISDIWKATDDAIDKLIEKYSGNNMNIETNVLQPILQVLFNSKKKVVSEIYNSNILSDKSKNLYKNIQLMKSSITSQLNSLKIENETTKKLLQFFETNDTYSESINVDIANRLSQLNHYINNLESKINTISKSTEMLNNNVEELMINSAFSMSEFLSLDVELLKKSDKEKDLKISKLEKIIIYQQNQINSLKIELNKQNSLMNEKIKRIEEKMEKLANKD